MPVDPKKLSLRSQFPSNWSSIIDFPEKRWESIDEALKKDRTLGTCFPPEGMEFEALKRVSPQDVKVVICGQDPYHAPGQAHGLAFSVPPRIQYPPSLRNIILELKDDLKAEWPLERDLDEDGVLGQWTRQGVLLLNDVLTVRQGTPGSHHQFGWNHLTGAVLNALADSDQPLAILLWGKSAKSHAARFYKACHGVFMAPHPSPLSAYRGFFGSRPFTQANDWLKRNAREEVNWIG